jgi:catechol 2,3-dioxygenase-like lactoylglutathione lyase family enzyme
MVVNVRHTGIVTDDLESSLKFYCDLLGFQQVRCMEESNYFIETVLGMKGVYVKTIKMSAPSGGMLELLHFKSHPKKRSQREINDIGISHVALTVDNVAQLYEDLKKSSVPFISSPRLSDDASARVAFCYAPEGTFVELVEMI